MYKKSQSFGVYLCYVPNMLCTRYRRAANIQCASHTCLGHGTEALSHKIGICMKHTLACLKRAPNGFEAYPMRL